MFKGKRVSATSKCMHVLWNKNSFKNECKGIKFLQIHVCFKECNTDTAHGSMSPTAKDYDKMIVTTKNHCSKIPRLGARWWYAA